jgi:hypothetical protein
MGSIDKTTFTAKVVELEIEARKKFIDIRQTIHDRSGELNGDEEALKLPSISIGAVEAMPVADADFDSTDTINNQITLTLDSDFGKPIVVSASAQAETPVALLETYAKNAEIAHRTNRNAVILAAIATAADTANQHYKYADTTDDVISAADILAAASVLDNAGAPDEGRYMAISASDHKYLFDIDNFISRDKMGQNGEAIPTNVIGMIHGFTVLKVPASEMPKINALTGAVDANAGLTSTLFWQQYAIAYGQHIYKLIGPELKAGADAEWYNLHHKFGADTQVSTFAVSYRKNK